MLRIYLLFALVVSSSPDPVGPNRTCDFNTIKVCHCPWLAAALGGQFAVTFVLCRVTLYCIALRQSLHFSVQSRLTLNFKGSPALASQVLRCQMLLSTSPLKYFLIAWCLAVYCAVGFSEDPDPVPSGTRSGCGRQTNDVDYRQLSLGVIV